MKFHQDPFNLVSTNCEDPKKLVNSLIEKYSTVNEEIKKDMEYFPGDTNFVGYGLYLANQDIDSVLHYLKEMSDKSL